MLVIAKNEDDLSPTVQKMVDTKEKLDLDKVSDESKIHWTDVKKAYPDIAENLKDLFKGKPFLTVKQLKEVLVEEKDDLFWLSEDEYDYRHGQALLSNFYGKNQEVLQFNIDKKVIDQIKDDPLLEDFFTKYSRLMASSLHPVHTQTIGWVRYYKFDTLWVVEEIQSDLFGENTRLRNFANSEVKSFVADYSKEEQAKLEEFFKENFTDWDKKLLSTLITQARREKIKDIWLFDDDVKAEDTQASPSKIKHFYRKIPRDMGFKRDSLNIDDRSFGAWHRAIAGLKPNRLLAALKSVVG